ADVAAAQGVDDAELFSLVVQDGSGLVETYLNVTVVDGPAQVTKALAASQLVQVTAATSRPAEGTYDVSGNGTEGRDGDPPNADDYTGDEAAKTGIYALLQADLFNLLCITPPTLETDVDPARWPKTTSTSRCAGSLSTWRRRCTAAPSGSSSSPTTRRCGPRSAPRSARSCRTCSAAAPSRAPPHARRSSCAATRTPRRSTTAT